MFNEIENVFVWAPVNNSMFAISTFRQCCFAWMGTFSEAIWFLLDWFLILQGLTDKQGERSPGFGQADLIFQQKSPSAICPLKMNRNFNSEIQIQQKRCSRVTIVNGSGTFQRIVLERNVVSNVVTNTWRMSAQHLTMLIQNSWSGCFAMEITRSAPQNASQDRRQ